MPLGDPSSPLRPRTPPPRQPGPPPFGASQKGPGGWGLRWAKCTFQKRTRLCRNARFKNARVSKKIRRLLQALVDSMPVRFQKRACRKMPLNIHFQWNSGTACVSECVLKALACQGLRVGPSRGGGKRDGGGWGGKGCGLREGSSSCNVAIGGTPTIKGSWGQTHI